MLLTCPKCRSGLEVPDGTTARVRCPSCQTIFAAAEGLAAPTPPPAPPAPLPRPVPARVSPAASAAPKSNPRHDRREEKKASQYPEYDEERQPRRRKRGRDRDTTLNPEEKKVLRAAFDRAMWGARLIWISLLFYAISMMLICLYYIHIGYMYSFTGMMYAPDEYFVIAGVLGLCNWAIAMVGVGLVIAGPWSPGHYLYSISAAIAVLVHAILLAVLVAEVQPDSQGTDSTIESAVKWRQIPTRLDSVTLYMSLIIYPDEFPIASRKVLVLGVVVGVAEMIRLMFIMMSLSCLARAAGDNELSGKCTRASAFVAAGPGVLALVVLMLTAFVIETNAQQSVIGRVILSVMLLGVSAMLAGTLIPPLSASRETVEACEFPFEKEIDFI